MAADVVAGGGAYMAHRRQAAYEQSLALRGPFTPSEVVEEPVVSCKRCAGPVVGREEFEDTLDRQQRVWACINPECLAVGVLSLEMTISQVRQSPVPASTRAVSRRRVHAVAVA